LRISPVWHCRSHSARQLSIVVAGPTSRCLERRPVTAGIIASSVDRFHAELSALSARNHQSAVVT
jgi:hypothetical protein